MVKMKNVLSIDIDYVNNVHDFKNLLRFYTKIINKVEPKNIIFSQIPIFSPKNIVDTFVNNFLS